MNQVDKELLISKRFMNEEEHQRIYSRLFEMCIPICFEGQDMRGGEHLKKREVFHQLLQ